MARIPDLQSAPMAPAIVISAGLLLVAIVIFFSWALFSSDSRDFSVDERAQLQAGIHFPPLEVDSQRLEDSRREHYSDPDFSDMSEKIDALRSLVQEANAAQFEDPTAQRAAEYQQIDRELRLMAAEIFPATGVTGFHALGTPIFDGCLTGLEELMSALQQDQLTPEEAQHPPSDRFTAYRENCGNLLPLLIERDLVHPDGTWSHQAGAELVDIIQRYRWADLIHAQYPTNRQLSPYELEMFYRWRIEDPDAFSIAERRRFLSRAERFFSSDYDIELTAARIDVADNDLEAASLRMKELSNNHPDSTLYRAISEEVDRQLARSSRR